MITIELLIENRLDAYTVTRVPSFRWTQAFWFLTDRELAKYQEFAANGGSTWRQWLYRLPKKWRY